MQGSHDMVDYALEFRTIATRSGWNELALKTAFRQGLNPELVRELACRGEQLTLDDIIDLAVRLDRVRRTNRPARWSTVPSEPAPSEEPMQLGRTRIHEKERETMKIVAVLPLR